MTNLSLTPEPGAVPPEARCTIHITYSIVTPESADNGDTAEQGFVVSGDWQCTVEEYDRAKDGFIPEPYEGESVVDATARFLQQASAFEPNDLGPAPTWWSNPEHDLCYTTGAREERAYHLEGYTEQELAEVAARMAA